MYRNIKHLITYLILALVIAGIVFIGCGGNVGTSAISGRSQSGQQNSQDMQALKGKILARAAEILGISSGELTNTYDSAIKNAGVRDPLLASQGQPPRPPQSKNSTAGNPGKQQPPSNGQTGQGGPSASGGKGAPGGTQPQGGQQVASGQGGGNPPPPQGGQNGQPPQGSQDRQGKGMDISAIYSKIAEKLGLTVEKVTAAFEQARKEFTPGQNQSQIAGSGNNSGTKTDKTSNNAGDYTLEQAISDKAQLSTIAFSGLAFITGSAGADSFFPPGKVADFFGFQYMRDIDAAGYGHNTTFLSKAANNVLKILTSEQKVKLIALAKEQEQVYINFAYNRFPLMAAFRNNMEGMMPSGAVGLNTTAVKAYTSGLYNLDAQLSYRRAEVAGAIIASFTPDQKTYLAKMEFGNSATWPDVPEDDTFKRSMTNTQFVAVMTYASEMFSWYKGNIDADIYFCPERHGTYFGGFYMKDYPAMNNPDYFISTSMTGDSGEAFLNTLNETQRQRITGIIEEQRSALKEIAQIRTAVSTELRKAMAGQALDKEKVYSLIKRYGELDGQVSALYASRFSEVNKTLTASQRASLVKLRNLTVVPSGAYMFATPIKYPSLPAIDSLFGIGQVPSGAGQMEAPAGFSTSTETPKNPPPQNR
jgi:Spy/CpxP family protein refolding chaperone